MNGKAKIAFLNSKTDGKLDFKKIKENLSRLNRAELRAYLLLLKQERNREKATIEVPLDESLIGSELVAFFKKKFPGKELEFVKNKNLIGGFRVRTDDKTLDLSLKTIIEKLYESNNR